MRYDQSMRVLKQILDDSALGDIVFAQIDMHAIPHWQTFLQAYDRLTLSNMSVHHLDVLRFLFGDAEEITTVTRQDPRTTFKHTDGITISTLRFPSGVLAVSLEDVWSGPRQEGYRDDQHINWRVEGTQGVARGTIGWPTGAASTLTYASSKTTGGEWVTPKWETMWFPHAFIGVMEQLQHAVKTGTAPALSVADNVKTMALVEAGYRSIDQRRAVRLSEISINEDQGRIRS
jgi:predicted dehydrogenase